MIEAVMFLTGIAVGAICAVTVIALKPGPGRRRR